MAASATTPNARFVGVLIFQLVSVDVGRTIHNDERVKDQ